MPIRNQLPATAHCFYRPRGKFIGQWIVPLLKWVPSRITRFRHWVMKLAENIFTARPAKYLTDRIRQKFLTKRKKAMETKVAFRFYRAKTIPAKECFYATKPPCPKSSFTQGLGIRRCDTGHTNGTVSVAEKIAWSEAKTRKKVSSTFCLSVGDEPRGEKSENIVNNRVANSYGTIVTDKFKTCLRVWKNRKTTSNERFYVTCDANYKPKMDGKRVADATV